MVFSFAEITARECRAVALAAATCVCEKRGCERPLVKEDHVFTTTLAGLVAFFNQLIAYVIKKWAWSLPLALTIRSAAGGMR